MGRFLDGIRLSGMLRSEIALVLRKEQLHTFLCFHQLLHLVPCFAIVWVGCFLLDQQFGVFCIQLLDLWQLFHPRFVKGSFRCLVQGNFLPVGFQKLFTVAIVVAFFEIFITPASLSRGWFGSGRKAASWWVRCTEKRAGIVSCFGSGCCSLQGTSAQSEYGRRSAS